MLKVNVFYIEHLFTEDRASRVFAEFFVSQYRKFPKGTFSMLKENEFYILRLYIKQGL